MAEATKSPSFEGITFPPKLVELVDERVAEAFDLGAEELAAVNQVRRGYEVRRITISILDALIGVGVLRTLEQQRNVARHARNDAIAAFRTALNAHMEHRGQEAGPEGYHRVVSCMAMVSVALSDYEQAAAAAEATL
jgi:hypothetical protein